MAVWRRRQRAQRGAEGVIGEQASDRCLQAGVRDLAGEELEEAVELLGVPPQRRGEGRRVGLRCGFERAHLELQPVAELFDTSEHSYGIAFGKAAVEQVDV